MVGAVESEQKKEKGEERKEAEVVNAIARRAIARSRQHLETPAAISAVERVLESSRGFIPIAPRFSAYIGFRGDAGGEAERRREGEKEARRTHCN